MIKRDFHGYALCDAIQEVELIIGDVRKKGITESAEFITGHGAIRIAITEIFNSYHLTIHAQIGNNGTLVATIE